VDCESKLNVGNDINLKLAVTNYAKKDLFNIVQSFDA
jgi:hypothetical protein